ncbi:MAG: cobalamin biosynthesis protein CobD [Methylobacteriaceae bacterium]|nr:cobalamin biosynthesis protein CobD [Methylobacteriaceae bacterium]
MLSVATLPLLAAALAFEAAFGYPTPLYRAIGHPVTWMGALLSVLERRLNDPQLPFVARRRAGVLALFLLLAATGAISATLSLLLAGSLPGSVLLVIACSSLLAQRSLDEHVRAVALALQNAGLAAGRVAVTNIVGRNPDVLDEPGVARAAIESLAENFSDGVVAPAFWMALAGLPGGALYKAINTADSMIGHRSERYAAFGWAAARLDDLVNLPAAHLSALSLVAAALLTRGASAVDAWRALRRDARRHRSPNAGWPEAAMAGALGLKLAGPRVYGAEVVEDAFMGDGRREATPADIHRALRLYRIACVLQWLVIAALALIVAVTG